MLKSLSYLGYFPDNLDGVPPEIKEFIAKQLNLLWDISTDYPTDERTCRYHLALIRKSLGWRFPTVQDKEELALWLRQEGARIAHSEEDLLECAYERLRKVQIELPAEKELRRLTNAALNGFFQDLYSLISSRLSVEVRTALDQLLVAAARSPL